MNKTGALPLSGILARLTLSLFGLLILAGCMGRTNGSSPEEITLYLKPTKDQRPDGPGFGDVKGRPVSANEFRAWLERRLKYALGDRFVITTDAAVPAIMSLTPRINQRVYKPSGAKPSHGSEDSVFADVGLELVIARPGEEMKTVFPQSSRVIPKWALKENEILSPYQEGMNDCIKGLADYLDNKAFIKDVLRDQKKFYLSIKDEKLSGSPAPVGAAIR